MGSRGATLIAGRMGRPLGGYRHMVDILRHDHGALTGTG